MTKRSDHRSQVIDKTCDFFLLPRLIEHSQERGRMYGDENRKSARRVQHRASIPVDPGLRSEQCVSCRGTKSDDEFWLAQAQFGAKPPCANLDLASVGLCMDAAFAASFELEVFDRIGEVTLAALDAGLVQAVIKKLSRRADEWSSGKILLVAGCSPTYTSSAVFGPSPKAVCVAFL